MAIYLMQKNPIKSTKSTCTTLQSSLLQSSLKMRCLQNLPQSGPLRFYNLLFYITLTMLNHIGFSVAHWYLGKSSRRPNKTLHISIKTLFRHKIQPKIQNILYNILYVFMRDKKIVQTVCCTNTNIVYFGIRSNCCCPLVVGYRPTCHLLHHMTSDLYRL